MAATAATAAAGAISSSLFPSISTLNNRLHLPSSDSVLRLPTSARLHLSAAPGGGDHLPLPIAAAALWRAPKKVFVAAVAQEEAEAEVETTPAEEEKGVEGGEETGEGSSGVNTKLYFGNLPYNVDSAQLAGIIQDYGSPELIEVLYDRATGRSRGFAFVTMSSVDDCKAVIQNLDGFIFSSHFVQQYMGRILRVNFSDKPRPREPLYPETEHKLFVGNLSWSVTSESLTEAFKPYGNVVGARVLYDGESGRSRGYGFVCYTSKSDMETALEALNGLVTKTMMFNALMHIM
ncbi:unnamed protein product [Linum tenue]|uniref:RRM domain-containing protein n=1 Tax=Linum tenue TaxID=586396 RepID=A0AAV0HD95_9ROSI|nr:unnamed protein product [Linum tenue]